MLSSEKLEELFNTALALAYHDGLSVREGTLRAFREVGEAAATAVREEYRATVVSLYAEKREIWNAGFVRALTDGGWNEDEALALAETENPYPVVKANA